MKIGELVSQAENAYFANDVKLDVFDDPEKNSALAACYKFTYRVPNGQQTPRLSAIKVLEKLTASLKHGLDENRHLVLAYYGHGKSHLALALANYFGKPLNSPEVEMMLQNIAHASDESVAQNFRDFKSSGLPYLVILLRGDEGKNLVQQFLIGLEIAIRRLPNHGEETLPFWFCAAERFLAGLDVRQATILNDFLSLKNIDVPALLQDVRDRRADRYDLCVEAFTHLHSTRPDFGGEISLEDAVKWAITEYCSSNKSSCAGLVVIFDEFLAFLEDYYRRMQSGGAGSALQSLLNGISSTRGKSLFVGFSQRDPDQALHHLVESGGGRNEVQVLQKELNRLPQPNRYQLYSSLETVLDGYLRQEETLWNQVYGDHFQSIQHASNRTRALMGRLYEDAAGWTDERFEEIVTKGCFPLHPLTTTLYCNLEIAGDSRQMLQFALDSLRQCRDESIVCEDGRLNWVYPTSLADFFQENLQQEEIGQQYLSARSRFGSALKPVQVDVLKGMMLYSLGGLKLTGRTRYPDAMALLTGHSAAQCQEALDELENVGAIEKSDTLGIYMFVRGGETRQLKEWLTRKRASRKFDEHSFMEMMDHADIALLCEKYYVEGIKLGHADEFSARETILPASLFNVAQVKKLAPRFTQSPNSTIRDGVRGAVIRVFSRDDEELRRLQAEVQLILDQALGESQYPLPVIICVPHLPRPSLVSALFDFLTLMLDSSDLQREYGPDVYLKERTRVRERIKQEMKGMREQEGYYLPRPYSSAVNAYAVGDKDTLQCRLNNVYQSAYRVAPVERQERFITQYRADNPTLRKAVGLVCSLLLRDGVSDRVNVIHAGGTGPTVATLVESYLRNRWQLLNSSESLIEPTAGSMSLAWNYVNKSLPVGDEPGTLSRALLPLLNPPFGLDYNQITLLFCAWYGLNRRTLEFQERVGNGWAARDFSPHTSLLDKPKQFLERICLVVDGRVRRRDAEQEHQENVALIGRARKHKDYSIAEARADLVQLKSIVQDGHHDSSLTEQAKKVERLLGDDIELAEVYAAAVLPIRDAMQRSPDAIEILKLRRKTEGLIEGKRVHSDQPAKATLLALLDKRLEGEVARTVERYSQLDNIRKYESYCDKLREMRNVLEQGGKRYLTEAVNDGLKKLDLCATELEGQKSEAALLSTMRGVRTRDTLAHLREGLRTLNDLKPITKSTAQQLEEKRQDVTQSILSLENALKLWEKEIDGIVEATVAFSLSQTLLQEKANYAETPEADVLKDLVARCRAVERCLRLVDKERATPLQNPREADERRSKLNEAKESYEPQLTAVQYNQLNEAQIWLNSAIETATITAEEWLREITRETQAGADAARLLRQLREIPAFLPEDRQSEVEGMRKVLQARLDAIVPPVVKTAGALF
jgi:hypothetical protein